MDQAQKQQFFTSFSERVNDVVVEAKMAELTASARTFSEMGLFPQSKQSLWGLIVVCSRSLYFYVPSEEMALMSMISAGAVAKDGTARKIGAKRIASAKSAAEVTPVRPVLPPAITPEADST